MGVFSPVNTVYKAAQVAEKRSWFGCQVSYSSLPTETQTDKREQNTQGPGRTFKPTYSVLSDAISLDAAGREKSTSEVVS